MDINRRSEIGVIYPHRRFFDRIVLWLGFTLFLGVLPMTVAYLALPVGRSWEEILWRGDAFILTSAFLGQELPELMRMRTGHRAKYLLICALLIIMVSCVSLFVATVANYTASHPPQQTTVVSRSPARTAGTQADISPPPSPLPGKPFGHLSDDMVKQFSIGSSWSAWWSYR